MNDFLLFLDTEASGLPKNWSLPYDSPGNWPYCVQVAWIIYTMDGREVKKENHYVNNKDFQIAPSAYKIHGITREFLDNNGEDRTVILQLLLNDLAFYRPLIVGHFMSFDLHMLGVDLFRAGLDNPLKKFDTFCTMIGSTHLIKNPSVKFLRLEQLFRILFNKTLENNHNALVDAVATASCFFELRKRRDFSDEFIIQQQQQRTKTELAVENEGCLFPVFFIIFLVILILYP